MSTRRDNIEVRLHGDGTVDEIVIFAHHDGRCLFHLEQMDDHYYWMRAYGITQDLVVYIGATVGAVRGEPILGEEAQKGKIYPHGIMFSGGKSVEIRGWEEKEGPKVWSNYEWEDSVLPQRREDRRTPETERRAQVDAIIGQDGVASVLRDIAAIYKQGRKADFEERLVADLEETAKRYLDGHHAYWENRENLGDATSNSP